MYVQEESRQSTLSVRKAVIPAAGLGTRLFPATKVAKKELLPVVDKDGMAKPAILLIVEEALNAGLEEIIIIVGPGDLEAFELLFTSPTPDEVYRRLGPDLQDYSDRILSMGRQVAFVIQTSQEGFGHAVYQARELVGSEPFLLMLGDHLYHTSNTRSCTGQLVEAARRHKRSMLGLRLTPEQQVGNYGTAGGKWIVPGQLLDISELAEKPTADYARTHLKVAGVPRHHYLTLFGLYVIRPRVFGFLEEQIAARHREKGEFQMTTALEHLRREESLLGLVIDGESYDIGLPESYLQTLARFGQRDS
jgi:UTP--glucose-1-phosphate uridylyltransferase